MTDARAIVLALGGSWDSRKRSGRCRCPAHDDATPSLDVAIGENGKTIFLKFCRQSRDS